MTSIGDILKSVLQPRAIKIDGHEYKLFIIDHERGHSCYCSENGITASGPDILSMIDSFHRKVKSINRQSEMGALSNAGHSNAGDALKGTENQARLPLFLIGK